jgi:hypothetical protein
MSIEILTPVALTLANSIYEILKKSRDINAALELPEIQYPALTQEQAISKVSKHYKNNKLVLILGAGVSIDQGIPSWKTLLQRLITTTLQNENDDEDKNKVLSQLFDQVFGPNPLIAARYLSVYFDDLEKKKRKKLLFEEAIRKALYETYDETKKSNLMKEIVQYCVSPGRTHPLDSVITYNYDDLLERNLENLNLDIPFKPIFSVGSHASTNQLPIFHVHGYLPKEGNIKQINKITLGDDSYHLQYNEIYRWSNLVQLQKFKDYNCLFLGISLTDPNQRRLLDIAKEQRGNSEIVHFLIKRKYSPTEIEKVVQGILKLNETLFSDKEKANLQLTDTVDSLVKIVENFESNDARSFGIEIIWVDDYKNIPEVMREIRTQSHS